MKLAFSTLGCPSWNIEEIVSHAQQWGYDGVELRGYQNDLFLPQAVPFLPENMEATRQQFDQAKLQIVCISSSACLSAEEGSYREMQLREADAYIELAHQLGVSFVRVFGGAMRKEGKQIGSRKALIENLQILGDKAQRLNIKLVMETHDDFIAAKTVAEILHAVQHPNVGVLWDIHHPYRFLKESLQHTLSYLRPFLWHIHIKDSHLTANGKAEYTFLGEGDIPVKEAVRLLHDSDYDGYLCVEWEKRWHPQLPEPEQVFPQYAEKLREYLSQINE